MSGTITFVSALLGVLLFLVAVIFGGAVHAGLAPDDRTCVSERATPDVIGNARPDLLYPGHRGLIPVRGCFQFSVLGFDPACDRSIDPSVERCMRAHSTQPDRQGDPYLVIGVSSFSRSSSAGNSFL